MGPELESLLPFYGDSRDPSGYRPVQAGTAVSSAGGAISEFGMSQSRLPSSPGDPDFILVLLSVEVFQDPGSSS